jgi:hypothetical protein
VGKALEKASGSTVFAISAPLEEGLERLLDSIIERLGPEPEPADVEDRPDRAWSPL